MMLATGKNAASVSLSPCGRGRGPAQSAGKVRGLVPFLQPPHPPVAPQWAPPSPARREGTGG